MTHGPLNVKLLVFLQSKPWLKEDAVCFLPLSIKNTQHYTNSSTFYLYHTTIHVLHGLFCANIHML